ncbi:MAG TPA: S41 family peptidase [Thermoanaerobaculia bacterium]
MTSGSGPDCGAVLSSAQAPSLARRLLRIAGRIAKLTAYTLLGIIGLLETLIAVGLIFSKPPDLHERWIADYTAARNYIARNYANLEWSIAEGRIDPHRLELQTLSAIRAARTDDEARRALGNFVAAFADPHMGLLRPSSARSWRRLLPSRKHPGRGTPAVLACRMLGYTDRDAEAQRNSSFDLERFEGTLFHRLEGAVTYPAGVITLDSGRFGLIRIPTFTYADHAKTCEKIWRQMTPKMQRHCDDACAAVIRNKVLGQLMDDFATEVSELSSRGIQVLVVDVTGDSGGYGSLAATFARTLTANPMPSESMALVRNNRTLGWLLHEETRVVEMLDSKGLRTEACDWLDEGRRRAVQAIDEFQSQPCDRVQWFTQTSKPDCSLMTGDLFQDGFFSAIPTDFAIPSEMRKSLFDSRSSDADPERIWGGPLILLVDRYTNSSAELFVQMLHDHAGAVVVGERTSGGGAGWLYDQDVFELPYSHLRLVAPELARFLKDGRNARFGIEPDLCLDRNPDATRFSRATTLLRALRRMS